MYSIIDAIAALKDSEDAMKLINDPFVSLGPPNSRYLGPLYLPEQIRGQNSYDEFDLRFQGVPVARDSSRYSVPTLTSSGILMSESSVAFGHAETSTQMRPDEIDRLNEYLRSLDPNTSIESSEAMMTMLRWIDTALLRPHLDKIEIQRWQALVKGVVKRTSVNGTQEDIVFDRPTNHVKVYASGTVASPSGFWAVDDATFDILDVFYDVRDTFEDIGYTISSIVCGRTIARQMTRHKSVEDQNIGSNLVVENGSVVAYEMSEESLEYDSLGGLLPRKGFPSLSIYKKGHLYLDPTSRTIKTRRFLDFKDDKDYIIFFANTNREQEILLPEEESIILPNTLGYYGVGTCATYGQPGRQLMTELSERHPRTIYGEAVASGFPVIQNPDAVIVVEVARPA